MQFEEFIQKCKLDNINIKQEDPIYEYPTLPSGRKSIDRKKAKLIKDGRYYVENKWCSGGMSGGNCYGDEPSPYYGEPKPEFNELENILYLIFPNISLLRYKKIQKLIQRDSYTDYEYYGNSYTYETEKVYLDDLYNFLHREGLLDGI